MEIEEIIFKNISDLDIDQLLYTEPMNDELEFEESEKDGTKTGNS